MLLPLASDLCNSTMPDHLYNLNVPATCFLFLLVWVRRRRSVASDCYPIASKNDMLHYFAYLCQSRGQIGDEYFTVLEKGRFR